MYIDNMFSRLFSKQQSDQQSLQPLLQRDDPALTQYVIGRKNNQEYISEIPEYNGNVIPTTLKKVSMFSSFESNYQGLKSFLENLGKYDSSDEWVVAGLLAGMDILVDLEEVGGLGAFTAPVKAFRKSINNKLTKQILCKRYGNKVVFLINVVESGKSGLNEMFSKKIMIMTLPPSHSSPIPLAVHADGFVNPPLPVYYYHVGVDEQGEPIEENIDIGEYIYLIERRLSDRPIFVIDPNKLKDNRVTVEWFGNMPLNAINHLIQRSGILDDSPPPPRTNIGTNIVTNIGGKSRYSKKRVTKRRKPTKHRKSTKRRHRRTTRKPT